ncbi:glycosyltransferase family 4 protein [Chthonomonas calidirosea]|uniref:glycosyltransferase family 4 protein n=1 Tax=Chthonomonas calidirosea TaxID=454171 RepID=UPI0009E90EE4|nr:glycosyltransferase family 4 protein [Chthonomonas calidirosea]
MRIMEIISGVGVNGAVVHCLLLTQELARRGNEVVLVCRHNAWIGQQLAHTANVTVVESDMRRWPLDELRRMAALARERQIEVINTHMSRAHNFGVFLQRFSGIPCVTTAHSHKIHPHWWFAHHIIAVSEQTRRYHLRFNRVRASRIDTVHGFVDVARFRGLDAHTRLQTRADLGVDEETFLVGAIGDFLPRKGQLYLVRALPQLLERIPRLRLALAGSVRTESYYQKVRREASRLGVQEAILWLGYRQDVPQLLAAFDVYTLVSLDEMFPVAILEAMAAQKPIVATAVGGTPECAAEVDSIYLIPPADPQAIVKALVELYEDPQKRAQLGQRAYETVCAHFTVEQQAPKIEAVFRKAIAAARR